MHNFVHWQCIVFIPTYYKIKPGDYGVFEKKSEGILIKPIHSEVMRDE